MAELKVFERYFSRNPVREQLSFGEDTGAIVIIPVFDDPDIFATIDSLCRCTVGNGKIGVLIVVNHSERCPEEIKKANCRLGEGIKRYIQTRQTELLRFEVVEAFDLPAKYAGVGLARKIAMDLAAAFFSRHGRIYAPILSLDADTWVEPNYLDEVVLYFKRHPVAGISIAYEHRLEGEGLTPEGCDAMVKYELYLRYYRLAFEYIRHPYAYHCIGSAFAVRTLDYVAQGGMNKRQAGEDFYFLQKIIGTGRYALLSTTCVYPSPRFSARTPFGTGRSVRQIVEQGGDFPVYCFEAFRTLKNFFEGIPGLYKTGEKEADAYIKGQSPGLQDFLSRIDAISMLLEVNANCASCRQFVKRFFDHFNAFRVLKYLNYVHEYRYRKMDIAGESRELFRAMGYPWSDTLMENLRFLRNLSRENRS